MELMQLQMLVAAAEGKSLQKAAERVSRTPQAVSMAIGKLEDEMGVLLFDRSSSRGFCLTAEGEVFVDYARRSLALLNEALAAVAQVGSAQRSRLRIGANQSIGEYLLPRLTHAFRNGNPGVRLKIVIGFSEFILSALRRGDVDVALVADKPRDRELKVQPLMTDRLIAILNPQHPLAGQESIQLKALGTESLVLLSEASELRERVVETFRRFGIPLNLHVETGTLDSIKRMVAQNMGIGIVPSLCVTKEEEKDLIVKTIKEFPEDRSLWIVHPLFPSAPCQAFVALLKSELAAAK
jgi:DNA-binding transcriptional LysR family regulator